MLRSPPSYRPFADLSRSAVDAERTEGRVGSVVDPCVQSRDAALQRETKAHRELQAERRGGTEAGSLEPPHVRVEVADTEVSHDATVGGGGGLRVGLPLPPAPQPTLMGSSSFARGTGLWGNGADADVRPMPLLLDLLDEVES